MEGKGNAENEQCGKEGKKKGRKKEREVVLDGEKDGKSE